MNQKAKQRFEVEVEARRMKRCEAATTTCFDVGPSLDERLDGVGLVKVCSCVESYAAVCCINSMHAHPVLDHGSHDLYMPPFSRHVHHWCLVRAASKANIRAGSQESYVVWHPSGQRRPPGKAVYILRCQARLCQPPSATTAAPSPFRLVWQQRGEECGLICPWRRPMLHSPASRSRSHRVRVHWPCAVQFRSELLPSPASVRGLCCPCPRQAQVELSAKPPTALMGILNTSKMRCNVCTSAPRSASRPLV